MPESDDVSELWLEDDNNFIKHSSSSVFIEKSMNSNIVDTYF